MPDHERRIHGISVMRNATGRGNRREEEEEKKKKKAGDTNKAEDRKNSLGEVRSGIWKHKKE